jgi:hypothetical protein
MIDAIHVIRIGNNNSSPMELTSPEMPTTPKNRVSSARRSHTFVTKGTRVVARLTH